MPRNRPRPPQNNYVVQASSPPQIDRSFMEEWARNEAAMRAEQLRLAVAAQQAQMAEQRVFLSNGSQVNLQATVPDMPPQQGTGSIWGGVGGTIGGVNIQPQQQTSPGEPGRMSWGSTRFSDMEAEESAPILRSTPRRGVTLFDNSIWEDAVFGLSSNRATTMVVNSPKVTKRNLPEWF